MEEGGTGAPNADAPQSGLHIAEVLGVEVLGTLQTGSCVVVTGVGTWLAEVPGTVEDEVLDSNLPHL